MRQRKISLSLLLACLLVLCCVPAAFAATDTPIDLSKIDQNISGTGWEWNFSNRCLTLTGLNLKNTDKTKVAAVILPADSVIVLAEGTKNVIETAGNNGLWCEGDLTIKGMGQLEIVRHDSSGDNLQNIVKEYDSAGILSETEGDLIIQSGTISIKNFENGIYFTSMGSYTQKGGYVSIQSREDLKSKGILASFGTVWIQNGKLHISANDFGVCCLGFLMDNGQVEINHLGERETGRAGVYVGSSVENKYYYYREDGLVAGVFLENGTLKTNGWINGVFVCDSGQYRQRGGFVKTTENTQYGICVLGGKQIQGSFQIMGGSVLAEGDVSAG